MEDEDFLEDGYLSDYEPEIHCLFPEACCMPGYHFPYECFTAEMAEEYAKAEDSQPAEPHRPAPTGGRR